MRSQVEADSSINQILQMLKNYRSDPKSQESELEWESIDRKNAIHHPLELASFYSTSKREPPSGLRLHASLEQLRNFPNQKIAERPSEATLDRGKDIFRRLHEEKKVLQQKRERLIEEGRRSLEQRQKSACTFSPLGAKRQNTFGADSFYKKNLEWQQRRQKEIKVKQCQKNTDTMGDLTFTPRINLYRRKEKVGKQNARKKGTDQFLQRQAKAKLNNEYLDERKRNPYSHVWNIKKGCFSYLK